MVRNELGKRQFAELLSPERGEIMQNIRKALDVQARQYGVEIVDVRIKKTDPPEGAPLDATYARMKSARYQEARTIEAQGLRQAQIIRADADTISTARCSHTSTHSVPMGASPRASLRSFCLRAMTICANSAAEVAKQGYSISVQPMRAIAMARPQAGTERKTTRA